MGGQATHAGPEQAALDAAQAMKSRGDLDGAYRTLFECVTHDYRACDCADGAAEIASDRGRYQEGMDALKRGLCTSARHAGLQSEMAVGLRQADGARRHALQALLKDPDEPHANYALAWALSTLHVQTPEALTAAEKAVRGGRGVPALLLLATIRADAGDSRGARDAIFQAKALAPNDPRVAYDLGVVERAASNYHGAREAFLHALALDPKLADARYALAQLTHSIGADDEARYDAEQLRAIAPDDPRLPALAAMLASHDGGAVDGAAR